MFQYFFTFHHKYKVLLLYKYSTCVFIFFFFSFKSYASQWSFGDSLPEDFIPTYGDDATHDYEGETYDFDHKDDDGSGKTSVHQYPYATAPNGCSSIGSNIEWFGTADFRPACNNHDKCYYHPTYEESRSAQECNLNFYSDLIQACSDAYDVTIKTCIGWKANVAIHGNSMKCVKTAEVFIPSTIPWNFALEEITPGLSDYFQGGVIIPVLGNIKEYCGWVALVMSGGVEAGQYHFFDGARKKQEAYEEWMTIEVNNQQHSNVITNIIHPMYQKHFGRFATSEEINEGIDLITNSGSSYTKDHYESYIELKFDNQVNNILFDVWDNLCTNCFNLHGERRDLSDEETKLVSDSLKVGGQPDVIKKIYNHYIIEKISIFMSNTLNIKNLNSQLVDSFIEENHIREKLYSVDIDGLLGEVAEQYVKNTHFEIYKNPLQESLLEEEMDFFGKYGYENYVKRKKASLIIPVLFY